MASNGEQEDTLGEARKRIGQISQSWVRPAQLLSNKAVNRITPSLDAKPKEA